VDNLTKFKTRKALLREKKVRCKFCCEEIEWGKEMDGRWLPLRKDLMGVHQCPGTSLPPQFERSDEEELI
jgi:hypothetical protein